MPEAVLLIAVLLVAGAAVLWPLRGASSAVPATDDERDAASVRHRVALEALRDVEADRRAGSLDDHAYAEQRAEAEARAAETAAALDGSATVDPPTAVPAGRAPALVAAAIVGVALVAASLVPATGVANSTVLDCDLALTMATGDERRACLEQRLDALARDADDPDGLSELADAYLAGSTTEDLANAVRVLQAVIALDPGRTDAYERVVAAYLRAGDHENARRALDSYAALDDADPVEVAFLGGLVALRAGEEGDAADAFDRFLELAPEDPRAQMVQSLREDLSD
jgi:cytochrome c-type biogenesis protein CcmH